MKYVMCFLAVKIVHFGFFYAVIFGAGKSLHHHSDGASLRMEKTHIQKPTSEFLDVFLCFLPTILNVQFLPGNSKQQVFNGCFNWMMNQIIIYIKLVVSPNIHLKLVGEISKQMYSQFFFNK